MNDTNKYLIYFTLYVLVFLIVVLSIWVWQIKRRGEKPPLQFKLLRGPGESLRLRMAEFDEQFLPLVLGTSLVPLVVGFLVLGILIKFTPKMPLISGLVITALPMIAALAFTGQFLMKKLTRNRNDRLGYLGERAVGEVLTLLTGEGYRVFHDVPAVNGNFKFNVDHVAVGPNGVFAIETKTRRKGRARAGYEAHKVAYDGRQLIWPWAEDSHGLKNAEDRARWLSEWLNKMTALGVAAHPVLVLPGWYVVLKAIGPVTVISHKQLAGSICRTKSSSLTPEQVDLIARQLDLLCRDVED